MEIKTEIPDTGVIVGRFQVHELHGGHLDLIRSVMNRHRKVIMILGCSPVPNTRKNPLDYQSRYQMLNAAFPSLLILPLLDVGDDTIWSRDLDTLVAAHLTPSQSAVLYGGRGSFLTVYDGKFPTQELVQEGYHSGTDVRDAIKQIVIGSPDFRAGVIWSAFNRFPTAFQTVDVVIFNQDYTWMLLAQKDYEYAKWRVVGGFSDPRSLSLEEDAAREVLEETDLIVDNLVYLGSYAIDDWRYRGDSDTVKTALFAATAQKGREAQPMDDIARVKWLSTKTVADNIEQHIYEHHQPLVRRACEFALSQHETTKGQK